MRPLTPAQTLVVGAQLDTSPTSERTRIRRTGLPPRTFETAARRLRESGVVYDRYLPNPTRFGVPSASRTYTFWPRLFTDSVCWVAKKIS